MCCDYYIQSDLVIIYIDSNNRYSKTITNMTLKKKYLNHIQDIDSDDDEESQKIKYNEELQKVIHRNNYKKNIYENDQWIKKSYKKRYLRILPSLCPGIVKIVDIYKNYSAWERNLKLLEL
jgi:hypothetical protein